MAFTASHTQYKANDKNQNPSNNEKKKNENFNLNRIFKESYTVHCHKMLIPKIQKTNQPGNNTHIPTQKKKNHRKLNEIRFSKGVTNIHS